MNNSSFIELATKAHDDKYSYSKSNYINYHSPIIITCKIHGDFSQTPATHLRKSGCPRCAHDKNKTSQQDFIQQCLNKHQCLYDYSKTNYTNAKTKICVSCHKHGDFFVKPGDHLNRGYGCPKCYEDTKINTTLKFIVKATSVHGNKYNYSKSHYLDDSTPIEIICSHHASFYQRKKNHLNGAGCPVCAIYNQSSTLSSFVFKANIIHNCKYDYSKSDYKGSFNSIEIDCPIHGSFHQLPSNHLQGTGCKKCSTDACKSSTKEFLIKAIKIHGYKYDYNNTVYHSAKDKVTINCRLHGQFSQKANNHLHGQGCPNCYNDISKPQQEIINFVHNNITLNTIINDRKTIKGLELDIFIPEYKLAIEYHGLYWHSYNIVESRHQKMRHQNKAIACLDAGINLFQIFEHEWSNLNSIIKSMIKHRCLLSSKINARQCTVGDDLDVTEFFNSNHIQGHRPAKNNICLLYGSEIIGACSYSAHSHYDYELIRMAFKQDHTVIGGVSKMLNHIKKRIGYKRLLTYANLRYSNAKGYINADFDLIGYTKPGYFYYHESSKQILSRQRCQKHKLVKLLNNYDSSLSETTNMFNNNFRRVWDAGNIVLINKSY